MIIALSNQKGGVAKTATAVNLGAAIAARGKKVLLVDCDAQGSMSVSLGIMQPDILSATLATAFQAAIADVPYDVTNLIQRHTDNVDFIPANIELSGIEVSLVNTMSRETVLRRILEPLRERYDYILLDTSPSLGLLTLNALSAADEVIIPVTAQFLPVKGLEQLLSTIGRIRKSINPNLKIAGILLTMIDRTNYGKEIIEALEESYGNSVTIFTARIPRSVKAAEASAAGQSVFVYDPRGKVADAYVTLASEALSL